MYQGKIPLINDKFDFAIFMQILKKSLWVSIVLILLSFFAAFLYLSYTQPLYSTQTIIQINENDRTTRLLNIEDVYQNDDISKVIELLRSKEFLKRAFSNLPLQVSYFSEGTFLSTELYKRSPFKVEWKAINPAIFNSPIYIEFTDEQSGIITTYVKKEGYDQKIALNQWTAVQGGEIKVSILNFDDIKSQQENYKSNRYYFIINNPQTLVDQHLQNLQVFLKNRSSQTIQVAYSGYNPEKAADIVNTIAEEYLKYDVESKKESAESILAFIEERLKLVYQNLDETEKQLHDFKKENKLNLDKYPTNGSPFPIFTAKISEFEDELINIEFELVTLQRISTQVEADNELNIYELIALLSGTKSEAILVSVLNNLQLLISEKEQLLNDVTPNNLKIKQLEKQIDNQKNLLIDFINSTVQRLESRKNDYKTKIAEYEERLFSDRNFDELEYSKLDRLYTINEGFYHKLIEKKAEYLISQAGYVSQNTILEKANVPAHPISPLSKKTYPVFLLLGLFLGGGFILVRYLLYDEVTSINTIQSYTNAPILGTSKLLVFRSFQNHTIEPPVYLAWSRNKNYYRFEYHFRRRKNLCSH